MFYRLKQFLKVSKDKRNGKKYKKLQAKMKKKLKFLKPGYIAYYGVGDKPYYNIKKPIYRLGAADPVLMSWGVTKEDF